jgi:regulator of RNase E activity RraA
VAKRKLFEDDIKIEKPEGLVLPFKGTGFKRAPEEMLRRLEVVSSATASALMYMLDIRYTFITGPRALKTGQRAVGSALTLQFMPQREDIASGKVQEEGENTSALWAVLDDVQKNDFLAIQAFGDKHTGCLGEMLVTSFAGRGGVGIVVDGYIRDWPRIQKMDIPLWTLGATPNFASQGPLYPWAYAVPIAVGGVLVMPGDIIIADDDGAVVVPVNVAPIILDVAERYEGSEEFSRMRLAEGGALRRYYPLSEEGLAELEEWKKTQGKK